MNRSRKLDLTTTPPLAQNPCCVSVGIIKHKCSFGNGTEIFKNKKSDGNYMTLATFNQPKTATITTTPITMFLVVNKLVGSLFLLRRIAYESAVKKLIGIYMWVCAPCMGNLFISTFNCCSPPFLSLTTTPSTASPLFLEYVLMPTTPPTLICVENGFVKKYFVIAFLFKFTCKYTKNLLLRWLFVFKNFLQRTLLEALNPIAHNAPQLHAVAEALACAVGAIVV